MPLLRELAPYCNMSPTKGRISVAVMFGILAVGILYISIELSVTFTAGIAILIGATLYGLLTKKGSEKELPVVPLKAERHVLPLSVELPVAPLSAELPVVPVSAELPVVPLSAELPVAPLSAELPVVPVSAELPVVPLSAELPLAPVSVELPVVPLSVNYHFTRRCNYKCGFCFHTAITSFELPLDQAKKGLGMLKDAGMKKINFSGGEPFLVKRGEYVGDLVKYCKQDLNIESVSIVSNGSLIKEQWFEKYGEYLDILAISCDSFNPETNEKIGRQQQGKENRHIECLRDVKAWCHKYEVAFKINSVINTYNKDEDMNDAIQELNPCRWKVFQCLIIDGENAGEKALRDAQPFVITTEEFNEFLTRHEVVRCLVPESNDAMRRSYLILDEYMRFLDGATKIPSKSMLDVGAANALQMANFDEQMFFKRGGKYVWSKVDMKLEW